MRQKGKNKKKKKGKMTAVMKIPDDYVYFINTLKNNIMRNIFFVIVSFIIVEGCANPENSNNIVKKDTVEQNSSQSNESKSIEKSKDKSNLEAAPDFLALSKNIDIAYQGYLQGVSKNDSSGPYFFKEYFSDTLSFQLIYFPKNKNRKNVNYDSIKIAEANNYQDYICFAFVYLMLDPDKMKDYHADNVIYPVNVKTYVRKANNWEFLSQSKVKNLRELSQYEIKSIYSIIH